MLSILRDLVPAISFITDDSRNVKPGSVFIAIEGGRVDGHSLLFSAKDAGAVAVVVKAGKVSEADRKRLGIPVVEVENTRAALAQLAGEWFHNPSHHMKMWGVTGTSGKTTMSYLLEAMLIAAGEKVGVIGTVNVRYANKVIEATHTTPGPLALQELLADMKNAGCTSVVMEVSSHALEQRRADGIAFDGVIFTNLSQDHLDLHETMEAYFDAKARLFTDFQETAAEAGKQVRLAISQDSVWGKKMTERAQATSKQIGLVDPHWAGKVVPFTALGQRNLHATLQGVQGRVTWEDGDLEVQTTLFGEFNIENVVATLTLLRSAGYPPGELATGLRSCAGAPGRMQRVSLDSRVPCVFIDYAHKPDALEKVLKAIRAMPRSQGSKVVTVFGCGGDRDRGKRPLMGRIAAEGSDRVIVTSDNPRTENPSQIIREIVAGIPEKLIGRVETIEDRRQAIQKALSIAHALDVILIAGKGHETYQWVGNQKLHFDDREEVLTLLAKGD